MCLSVCPYSLGPLVRKIKDTQVEVIINELCSNMFSEDERLRDISSVGKWVWCNTIYILIIETVIFLMFFPGLKTVISQLPHVNNVVSNAACKNITNQLVKSIGNSVSLIKSCYIGTDDSKATVYVNLLLPSSSSSLPPSLPPHLSH